MRLRLASLIAACAALAAAFAEPPAALAGPPAEEEKPALFTVIAAPGERFGERVLAELLSLGFDAVRSDPPDETASRVSLESAARNAGAIAAIRAVPSERGVEVWIADRVTGKTVLREIAVDPGAAEPETALAIRAVELLRASLLELSLPAATPGEVAASPALREKFAIVAPVAPATPPSALPAPPLPPPPITLRFSVAPGVLLSPGGFGPAALLEVGVAWLPGEHVGAAAFAAIPLSRPRVSSAAGSADLATTLAGGGARFLFTGRASRWAPSLDVGATAISLQVAGSASAGYAASASEVWTGAPFVRAGAAFAPNPMLRVRADLFVTAIFEGATVRLAGKQAATFGRPIVAASAGVDFGWL